MSSRSSNTRVLIIGAGMSGLACARELQQRGYQVLVVEARNRVGGRLKGGTIETSTNSSSSTKKKKKKKQQQEIDIDLGGAFIHGMEESNPIAGLAQELGLAPPQAMTSDWSSCLLLTESGWPVDPKQDDRISAIFNECLEECFLRIEQQQTLQQQQQQQSSSSSFGDLFEQVCREKSVPTSALLRWHQANLELSCGASFDELGWMWNDDEPYGFDGEHAVLQHSWKPVVQALASDDAQEDGGLDILYNAPVQQIHVVQPKKTATETAETADTSANTATAPPLVPPSAQPPSSQQQQHDKKGKATAAAAASAATAITATTTTITPTRQSRRLRGVDANARRSSRANKGQAVDRFTIQHPTTDNNAAIHNTNKRARQRRQRPEDVGPKKTKVQVTLQNGVVLEADAVVCTLPLGILKKLPPQQEDDDHPNNSSSVTFVPPLPTSKQQAIARLGTGLLNKCVLSFPFLFWQDSDFLGLAGERHSYLIVNGHAYTGQPILIFMYGGAFAKEVEDWTDQEIVADCLKVLKTVCGLKIGATLPEPLDYRVTRWGHEQYSRMAFTYIPPGVNGFAELQAMSQPIYDHTGDIPALMFAGEHTTPYHPSTIHGAFLSGIREAYRLDCKLCPEENNNLVFSDSELYQRTFSLQRRFFGLNSLPFQDKMSRAKQIASSSKPAAAAASGGRAQHRRRGATFVMKLRQRPKGATKADHVNGKKPATGTDGKTAAASPSRRSQRSSIASKTATGTHHENGTTVNGGTAAADSEEQHQQHDEPKRDLTDLENRSLMRGMESYGRDFAFLQATTLPVHGSNSTNGSSTTTLAQVRKRCQQLSHLVKKARAPSTTAWKQWTAKIVYPATTSSPQEEDSAAVLSDGQDQGVQKMEAVKEQAEVPPPVDEEQVVTTRSGRTVKKPRVG